jgi:tetratricopeptide (TPR) repeat protein
MEKHHVGAQGSEWDFTPIDRLLIAGRALWFYAGKLAWPHPLVFFYPRWTVDAHVGWQYLFPAAALAVIVGLWLARARVGRGPLAAVLIFAGVLTPALGFFDVFPFRFSFVADHFQYHASVALIALAAAGGTLGAHRANPRQRAFAKVIAPTVLTILTVVSLRQTLIYQNLETLYRDAIAHNSKNWLALSNLASYLHSIGRHDESIALVRQALPLGPREPDVHNNMGAMLFEQGKRSGFRPGQLDEATSHLKIAVQLDPRHVEAHFNLAIALIAAHQPEQAIGHLNSVLELNPSRADAHFELGNLLVQRNELQLATGHFGEAVRLRSRYVEALHNLGATLLMMGHVDEAIAYFNEVIRLKPDSPKTRANLERALEAKQRAGPR